jgi:hypothetical protein
MDSDEIKQRIPKPRKPRADKGKDRIVRSEDPENFSFILRPEHPIEGRILQAIRSDLTLEKKKNPNAKKKTILIKWLVDYLDLDAK